MEQGHVNRFVDYLNTLRTQTEAGNAFCFHEARGQATSLAQFGLSPSATHTRTRLDGLVEDALHPDFPFRAILLTGDAGDGKTACCEQLATALYGSDLPDTLRAAKRLEGGRFREWVILKDGSELNDVTNSRMNLDSILSEELRTPVGRYLLAVNEGRLRSSCRKGASRHLWESVVGAALQAREGSAEQVAEADSRMRATGVLVVNLRDRCLPADAATFDRILDTVTSSGRWESGGCAGCPAQPRCHIIENARSLRSPGPRQRLRRVLLAAYDSGQALPYRRLQGFVAYAITGGYACTENAAGAPAVQRADYATEPELALRARYYNTLFGYPPTANPATRPEPITRFLQRADPASMPAPECDRLLAGAPPEEALSAAFGAQWSSVDVGLGRAGDQDTRAFSIRALKRKAFFEVSGVGAAQDELGASLRHFAQRFPFESFEAYDRAISAPEADRVEALREACRRIVKGLNGLDGTAGDTLQLDQLDPQELSQGTRFGLSIGLRIKPRTSVTRLPEPPPCAARYLEHRPAALVLTAADEAGRGVRLRVDLGLFELLHAVSLGFRAPQAFGTYLLDVQRFKERLIRDFGVEGERTNLAFRRGGRLFRICFEADDSLDVEVG